MQLRFNVDRVSCFRSGINTGNVSATLDIDPASLSQETRDILASRINQRGEVCSRNEDGHFHDGHYTLREVPQTPYNDRCSIRLVTANGPSLEALLDAICKEESAIATKKSLKEEKDRQEREERRAATMAVLKERKVSESQHFACVGRGTAGQIYTRITDWKSRDDEVYVTFTKLAANWPYRTDEFVANNAEATAWLAELEEINQQREAAAFTEANTLFLQREGEEQAAREAEEEYKRRKAGQIHQWVLDHGDSNMIGRMEEGLLSEEEVIADIREKAFSSMEETGWARYSRITAEDFETCHDEDNVDCEVTELTSLSADEYESLLAFRNVLPDAKITPRLHKCECSGETIERKSLHIAVTVGVFTFSREYAL